MRQEIPRIHVAHQPGIAQFLAILRKKQDGRRGKQTKVVEQIEIEKKQKAQDRPPILDAPIAMEAKHEAS